MNSESSGGGRHHSRLLQQHFDSRSLPRLNSQLSHFYAAAPPNATNGVLTTINQLDGGHVSMSNFIGQSGQASTSAAAARYPLANQNTPTAAFTSSATLPAYSSQTALYTSPSYKFDQLRAGSSTGQIFGTMPADPYNLPLPTLQREYEYLRQEFENLAQKFNTTMTSIKTFWSPELKKERAVRKEETAKLVLLQEQMKMSAQENQKQLTLTRQLQDELHCQFELSRSSRSNNTLNVNSYDPAVKKNPQEVSPRQQNFPIREEFEVLRAERDQFRRDSERAKAVAQELEMQVDLQRRTLAARDESYRKLMDVVQSGGSISPAIVQDRMEYEATMGRLLELEQRCVNLESLLNQKEQDVQFLQEECLNASNKFKEMQTQYDYCQRSAAESRDTSILHVLLKTKMAIIDQLEQRIALYEDEISRLREHTMLRHANERSPIQVNRENFDLKQKVEQLELELNQKQLELLATNTRLSMAEEQTIELRKHLEVVKESNSKKEQQIDSLQNDIELSRSKFDTRSESLEAKDQELKHYRHENSQLLRKIDELKTACYNRPRSESSQAANSQDEIDGLAGNRLNDLDENTKSEINGMRLAVETLQKEIIDRQVLIESQSEKISDVNRELAALKLDKEKSDRQMQEAVVDAERLSLELSDARCESERLLRMVQAMDKEKESINLQIKDLENKQTGEARQREAKFSNSYEQSEYEELKKLLTVKEQRIEELEEALKESVSITAERELLIAQQKHSLQILEPKLKTYKDDTNRLQKQYEELNEKISILQKDKQEKDAIIRSLKHERRKHLEEVLQLKEEYLLAAISEKDAHIALLESAPNNGAGAASSNQDEIETLRKHKEKLMKRMKEENNRRIQLLTDDQEMDRIDLTSNLVKALKSSPSDQEDEAEGIWA